MTLNKMLIATSILLSFAIANSCPVDSSSGAQHSSVIGGKSKIIDSLHIAMKQFRAEQGKKILELRAKIDAELVKPNPDKKLLASYVAKQSELRQKIADKWLQSMLSIKSLTKEETFPQYVKGNWGCKCGDSDFGCVPKKEAEVKLDE
jgi:hypothetical protein